MSLSLSRLREHLPAAGLVLLAGLCGTLLAKGSYIPLGGLLGILVGSLVLLLPAEWVLGLLMLLTFVVQGCLTYFLNFEQASWLPGMFCGLIAIRLFVELFRDHAALQRFSHSVLLLPMLCLFGYLGTLLVSSLVETPPVVSVIFGVKNALPFWFVTLFVIAINHQERVRNLFWWLIGAIFFLQLPLVILQHFVIAPARQAIYSWDAVVGTFGGNMEGGGSNSTLTIFAIWGLAYFGSLYQRALLPLSALLLAAGTTLAIIFLGEVKAAFLWLPMAMAITFRKLIFRNVTSFLLAGVLTAGLLVAIWTAYDALYWSSETKAASTEDRMGEMYYFFDEKQIDPKTGEISRGAALAIWWKDMNSGTHERLIGYGISASRTSATAGSGVVAKRYLPLDVAATTATQLLWETGVIGLLFFCGVLVGIPLLAWRELSHPGLSALEGARLESLMTLSILLATTVIYNRYLVDEPPTQLMLALSLGYVAFWVAELPRFRPQAIRYGKRT